MLGAIVMVVLECTGCGSSSSSNGTTAQPTKAEFIAKARRDLQTRTRKVAEDRRAKSQAAANAIETNDTPKTRAALAGAIRAQVRTHSATGVKIRALGPPREDRVTVSKYIDAGFTAITLYESLASAVESNDVAR